MTTSAPQTPSNQEATDGDASPRALIIDFETRSRADLKAVGSHKYASDPSTEILCAAFAVGDGPLHLWTPGNPVPPEVFAAARGDFTIVAHNAQFELAIMHHVLIPRHGWPEIPLENWRCTMAMAHAAALPGSLEAAAEAMKLTHIKDKAGAKLMLRVAKPLPDGKWLEDQASLDALYDYCRHDVEVERSLFKTLPPLTDSEQAIWVIDQIINSRGVHVDAELLEAAAKVVEKSQRELLAEFNQLTGLRSPAQVSQLISWLADHGCAVADLKKATLSHALRRKDLSAEARRAIEIRRELSHASAGKIDALLAWRMEDDRVRGAFVYHGAATGRWVGRGPQLQNFKRSGNGTAGKIEAILAGGEGLDAPIEAAGDVARAAIIAAPGHRLMVADFTGIESRVLAWVAGEQRKIALWAAFDQTQAAEDDPYVVIGRSIGHGEAEARAAGKIADLAFGYQGGAGAWNNFATADDTSDEETVKRYRDAWRSAHPATAKFWKDIDRVAIKATENSGIEYRAGRISFRYDPPFLRAILPSGRAICYPFPRIIEGRYGPCVVFQDNAGGRMRDCRFGDGFYGGCWAENTVSGVARDLLAAALVRLEAAGYPVVLHVHDEVVCEVPTDFGSLEEFRAIIEAAPAWAQGLPIRAKAREGQRFTKDDGAEPVGTGEFPQLRPSEPDTQVEVMVVELDHNPDDDDPDEEPGEDEAKFETDEVADQPDEAPHLQPCTKPAIPEVLPGSPEFEQILKELTTEEGDGAHLPPTEELEAVRPQEPAPPENTPGSSEPPWSNGNGAAHPDLGAAPFQGCGNDKGDYGDRTSEHQSGKPYGPIKARLLGLGYQIAQTFPFSVPGGAAPLYYEDRYELRAGITPTKALPRKQSRYWHRVNGQDLSDTGPRRIIYNWSAIMAAGPGAMVFITEGANKSKPLNDAGLLATAAPYHQWGPECVQALAGLHLIYLEDHNPPGGDDPAQKYSADARHKLVPGAASFRVVSAAHLWKSLGRGGDPAQGWDVKDWIELGGDPAKLLEICREITADGAEISILSKSDFLSGFVPPDYLIDGMLQRRFIYSLTGQTGHAKTAIALRIAQLVDAGGVLDGHEVAGGRVAYLVGENRDDVRMRVIGDDAALGDKGNENIIFVPGVFDTDALLRKVESLGELNLIIIDTSAAYFLGDDENSNPQLGEHARKLRKLISLPGGPCGLVLCHPIKHASEPSQLLPRGGGAFLAEMDGNLTAWKDNLLITLHHSDKFRGPGFEPITFRLDRVETMALQDSRGRLIPTIRAVAISETEEEQEATATRAEENWVLLARLEGGRSMSIADLARALNWSFADGRPYKSKVQRALNRLKAAGMMKSSRGDWDLTDKGEKAAREFKKGASGG